MGRHYGSIEDSLNFILFFKIVRNREKNTLNNFDLKRPKTHT